VHPTGAVGLSGRRMDLADQPGEPLPTHWRWRERPVLVSVIPGTADLRGASPRSSKSWLLLRVAKIRFRLRQLNALRGCDPRTLALADLVLTDPVMDRGGTFDRQH
jgi:hypothetical protein